MSIERKNNEKDFEYIKRLVVGKLIDKTIDKDFAELSEAIFGEGNQFNSSEVRKRLYGMRRLLEVIEEDSINNISNDELSSELDEKLKEIKLERNKLSVERNEVNKIYREKARIDLRFERLEKAIESLEPVQVPIPYLITEGNKEGILTISDTHFGRITSVKGLRGEILNEYNEDIFEDRMWQVLESTIHIIRKENLEVIRLILNGDLVDGMLRQSQLSQLQYGLVDQTMRFAEFITTWINELSKYCYVEVYSSLGNHDQARVLNAKNGEFPQENMSRIIYWYIKTRLNTNLNVNINENNNEHIFFNIFGLNIMAGHGEEKNIEQALKDYMLLYNERIDLFITGHLHSSYAKSVGLGSLGTSDVECIRVKSICGIDDYSMKLRKSSGAGTSLIIIEECKGKTMTYDINLV